MRAGKTIGAATTDYLVDLASTLPVVISDTDAIYLYGLDIIAEQLAGADRYYYVHDGLGSVRQLVESTGQIATRYACDPFGVPLAGNGAPNPWQFTGEAWDAEVELLYLRARYYQPETGRFTSQDPSMGDLAQPTTLHGWAYVENNPVNLSDPTGLIPVAAPSGPLDDLSQGQDDRDLTYWLYREMTENVVGEDAREIRELLASQWPQDRLAAIQKWIGLVADHCRRDFKHEIRAQLRDTIMLHHVSPGGVYGESWHDYSVPGNIYFAWMGMAVGFTDQFLHLGAGVAEVVDPVHKGEGTCITPIPVPPVISRKPEMKCTLSLCPHPDWWDTYQDEPGDWFNVEFGTMLHQAHGSALSYSEWRRFLGNNGYMLSPREKPANAGRYRAKGAKSPWPYDVGSFDGSGCSGALWTCEPL